MDDIQLPPKGYVLCGSGTFVQTARMKNWIHQRPEVESEDEENLMEDTEDDYEEAAAMTHTVTFKCISATKTP